MKKCKNCDEEIDDDEEFCEECKKEEMDRLATMILWNPNIPPNIEDFT